VKIQWDSYKTKKTYALKSDEASINLPKADKYGSYLLSHPPEAESTIGIYNLKINADQVYNKKSRTE